MYNIAGIITHTKNYAFDISAGELREIAEKLGVSPKEFPDAGDSEDFDSEIITWLDNNSAVMSFLIEQGDHVGLDDEELSAE